MITSGSLLALGRLAYDNNDSKDCKASEILQISPADKG